jgi:hypothetical protein
MTELLSLVLQTASRLPDERQDEIARAMGGGSPLNDPVSAAG